MICYRIACQTGCEGVACVAGVEAEFADLGLLEVVEIAGAGCRGDVCVELAEES